MKKIDINESMTCSLRRKPMKPKACSIIFIMDETKDVSYSIKHYLCLQHSPLLDGTTNLSIEKYDIMYR